MWYYPTFVSPRVLTRETASSARNSEMGLWILMLSLKRAIQMESDVVAKLGTPVLHQGKAKPWIEGINFDWNLFPVYLMSGILGQAEAELWVEEQASQTSRVSTRASTLLVAGSLGRKINDEHVKDQ